MIYKDVPYYHNKEVLNSENFDPTTVDPKTVTLYNVQEVRQEGAPPMYVLSESVNNQGPGFDDIDTRDGVAEEMAQGIQELDQCKPREVRLFQERPDGDYDRVDFRDIGRDGQSSADQEFQEKAPNQYESQKGDQEPAPERPADWSEYHRETYTREDLQRSLGDEAVHVPERTPQQEQESPLADMYGPATNRSAEQTQQLIQHVQQAEQQQEF